METMTNKLRRTSIWLATFAVLLAAIAPTVSRIVFEQTLPAPGWVEICTIEGMQQLPEALFENAEASGSEHPATHHGDYFEHCPFCFTNAFSFGLTPAGSALLPLMADEGHRLPPHALSALHAKSVWQPNQARGPPVFL
jgi:hypothetical protein